MARTRKQTSAQNLFKYDVLIEDRGERSDYFKLSQFNGYFTGGRNAFLVAGSPVLKPNTKLLVEVLDKNGRAIFSAPAKDFIEANSRLVQVEVYEDTPIGQGKIVILGCAVTYADGTPVPKEWQDKYNVRWISNVTISPQKENTTPIRFNTPPSMVVQEKFYFAPESSSFSSTATASLDVKLDTKFFNVFPNGYLLTSKGVPDERYFTKYLGGVFTGSVEINGGNGQEFINVNIPITRIYNRFVAESDGTLLTTNKGTVITDVYLSSSGQYTTLVNKTYPAQVTSSIVLQYNELITQNTGSIISFADVRIVDLSTISGEVHSVEFSYKRTTEPGEYTILGKVPTTVRELLAVDSASRIAETGLFRDVVLKDYWYSTTMSLSRTDTVLPPPEYYTASLVSAANDDTLQSCFFLLDAITGLIPVVDGKFIDNVSYAIGTRETTSLELFPRSEYTLTFDALVSKTSGSTPPITLSQDDYSLEVYLVPLSGSNTTLLETNARGQLIGTLTPKNGFSIQNFETVDLNFIPKIIAPGTFGLRFIVYGGFWNIANVSVKPATERFFSPDEISVLLPNEFTHDELVTYRAEYLDINNNSLGIQTTALPTFFDGIGYVSRQGDTMFGELYIKDLPIYTDALYDGFTGLVSGGQLIINPEDPTEYIITAGSGYYITGSLTEPEYRLVTWSQITKLPDAFPTSGSVATTPRTNVAITVNGTVYEQPNRFTPEQYRDYIVLGRLAHVGTNTIQRTLSLPLTAYARGYHWFDLASALGIINVNGNVFSPAGNNRQIQKSNGQTYRVGSNYRNDPEFPDITTDPNSNPTTFAYRWRNSSGGWNEAPATTFVSGGFYDNGTGTLATVNNNQWTTQRIYYFGATNTTRIQFGQFVYNSLSAALSSIQTELFIVDPNLKEDAALRSLLVLRGGAANLSSLSDAKFLEASGLGFSGTSDTSGVAGPLETVFYVTQEGNDTQNGKTLERAFRTIKKATEAAAQFIAGDTSRRVSIHVKSGYYTEIAPVTVPINTSILGDDLRTVVVRPTPETKTENLFLMNNATYAWGLRLEGCEIDNLEDPRKGFFFAFAPNAFIVSSPYVQNCTAVHTPPLGFYAPLDFDNENPFVGNGPGGMIVDDSVLNGYSPLKSMIVDAYTQVAFNGIGICIRGRGYAQLVSFFTNFSRIGVYALDGGHASLLNSNTTFGDYGLRSKGSRILVIPDKSNVSGYLNTDDATLIESKKSLILAHMIFELQQNGNYASLYEPTGAYYESTLRDAGLLIDSIVTDLRSPNPGRVVQFTQGLFKGQDITEDKIFTTTVGAVAVFPVNDNGLLAQDFILSYEVMRDYIINDPLNQFSALTVNGSTKIQQLFELPINTLTSVIINESDELLQIFGSLITSTSHDFSYAGAGVNFLALPPNQGGIGETNITLRIVEEDGGRVFHTSGDETGDFYAGADFTIKQATGIIEGRALNKAITALVTPLNFALEG